MKLSSFSINTLFVVLMLLGVTLIPNLSVQLWPSSRSNTLSVSFSWPNANPELLEMEVTSKLEAAFARTSGLTNLTSSTSLGYGNIVMDIDKNEDIDGIKLYLSSVIASIRKEFPKDVWISNIQGGGVSRNDEDHTLQTYSITGPGSTIDLAKFAEENIASEISQIEGVEQVNISGGIPFEWLLTYNPLLLEEIGISEYDIKQAIYNYYHREDVGKVLIKDNPEKQYSYLIIKGNDSDNSANFLDIPITNVNHKIVRLRDIVTIDYCEKEPESYTRINGLNDITINITYNKGCNTIELANIISEKMRTLGIVIGKSYSLTKIYDSSLELKEELNRNIIRTIMTILILLLFVWVVSRSLRYLLIITIALAANILIALAFYYFFKIEIHIYTLAGITVSFGIIIDNVIVMTDHYRHNKNRKVFMAILAATFTTMGALVVIFNMDNDVMRNMWGFSTVIIINLAISLFISLLFVPALMEKIPLKERMSKHIYRRTKRVVKFTKIYSKIVTFTHRYKKWLITIVILGFGIPSYLIPTSLHKETWGSEQYNALFRNETLIKVKPWIDKCIGGSMRLFTENNQKILESYDTDQKQKSFINVTMTMPYGASLKQMNQVFIQIENFLAGYNQIDIFKTNIWSANTASMKITFKPEHEFDGSPERIKNALVEFTNKIGNADADISGVGRGFSNRTEYAYRSEVLKVTGYNYHKVLQYAEMIKASLEEQKRVKRLYIGSSRYTQQNKEYTILTDNKKLSMNSSNLKQVLNGLSAFSKSYELNSDIFIDGKQTSIILRSSERDNISLWDLNNQPLKGDSSSFRLSDIGIVTEGQNFNEIIKNNQEYEVSILYDFMGDYILSNKIKKRIIDEASPKLGIGFKVKDGNGDDYWQNWRGAGGIDARVWYILLVITIIWFICTMLLESIKQAFIVILIAPISFIGSFLGFYLFKLQFNEGGLAAFILMCGLSVNSILYIINDYNTRIRAGKRPGIETYMKSFNAKIIPILLTIFSTVLGFIPFLIGETSTFWESLAIGTMSGLIFSLLVLFIVLPTLFLNQKNSNKQ